ncbi:MAG: hypothetical protein ABIT37_09805 [Luteolibacter sp.]
MRAKQSIIFFAGLFLGIAAGVMGYRFLVSMKAYASVSQHVLQGRQILENIQQYTKTNGKAPDQDWFDGLGKLTITSEGHHWTYYTPPKRLGQERDLVISTATDYGHRILGGFADGSVLFTNLHTERSEQAVDGKPH